jgi:hypothetical protein
MSGSTQPRGMSESGWFMRKFLKYALILVIGIAAGLSACLAVYYFSGDVLFEKTVGRSDGAAKAAAPADAANDELITYAYRILGYIKEGDYNALSQVIHPEYGVVFSPYATISLSTGKYFTASQIAAFEQDENKYVWGKYDGSGDPIELTLSEYFETFVYNKDYTLSPEIGVNAIVKSGNSLENITEVFPDVRYVDFYMPGADSNSGGLDWSSLRLGFEEYLGELKLTVVVHSQWTV